MLYRYILLLKREMLAERNVLNCFISCSFPGLLSFWSNFHVLIGTFAVLEALMDDLPSLQCNDSVGVL